MVATKSGSNEWTYLESRLESLDPQIQLSGIRALKNSVIGNQTNKQLFLSHGVADILIRFLSSSNSSLDSVTLASLHLESAVAVGTISLALFFPFPLPSCLFSLLEAFLH